MKNIIKLGLFLMIVAALAAAALSLTYVYTKPKIEGQLNREINEALLEVLPSALSFDDDEKNVNGEWFFFYVGFKEKRKVGLVIPVASKGYGGPIDMLVGINKDGKVTGVKIIKLSETPGLGLNATEPSFLDQFKGKSIENKLKAKLDIQAITGATITSQAVANGVKEALEKFDKLGIF